jgi:hypothetical protein
MKASIVLAERPDPFAPMWMAALAPNPRSLVDAIRPRRRDVHGGWRAVDAHFGVPAEATAEEGYAIVEVLGAILF